MLHKLCRDEGARALLPQLAYVKENEPEPRLQFLLNQRNSEKYTPLHVAIFARNFDAFKVLVEFGADINAKCHGVPPMHLVVRTAAQPEGQQFGFAAFQLLVEHEANLLAKDDNLMTILHLAAAYNFTNLFQLLQSAGVMTKLLHTAVRLTGHTALHLAAGNDHVEAVQALLTLGASATAALIACKSTPLHVAAHFKCASALAVLIRDAAAAVEVTDVAGRTAGHILQQHGLELSKLTAADVTSPQTALVTSSYCLDHHTCPPSQLRSTSAPPENLRRLQLLVNARDGVLRCSDLQRNTRWIDNADLAPISDILRVHEWTYARHVQQQCDQIGHDPEQEDGMGSLDADTTISRGTYTAALGAAGAVCRAIDEVMSGKARNAFCPVRPPGHHAGPKGVVKAGSGSDSHGFCIFNNVSVGAAYAMNRHRDTVRKVAIVDFDVHHGNGTEETVRWLRPVVEEQNIGGDGAFGKLYSPKYKPWLGHDDSGNVLFVSVHGYGPRERGLESLFPLAAFYPGTGPTSLPDVSGATTSVGADGHCKLGDVRSESSASSSRSSASARHQSKSMDEEEEQQNNDDDDENDDDDDDDEDDDDDDDDESWGEPALPPVQAAEVLGAEDSVDRMRRLFSAPYSQGPVSSRSLLPVPACPPLILDVGVALPPAAAEDCPTALSKAVDELSYRIQWRNYFREMIFPRLRVFQPDLVLISAGFDAHKRDTINAGYISLVDEDYAWVTAKLAQIAESTCAGRVVSVLEGGYQLGGEYCSAFARSVHDHVLALTRAGRAGEKVSEELEAAEQREEEKLLMQLRQQREEEILQEQLCLRQEEVAEAEAKAAETAVVELTHSDAAVAEIAAVPSDGDRAADVSARKRKRPTVDYAALDQELRRGTLPQL